MGSADLVVTLFGFNTNIKKTNRRTASPMERPMKRSAHDRELNQTIRIAQDIRSHIQNRGYTARGRPIGNQRRALHPSHHAQL